MSRETSVASAPPISAPTAALSSAAPPSSAADSIPTNTTPPPPPPPTVPAVDRPSGRNGAPVSVPVSPPSAAAVAAPLQPERPGVSSGTFLIRALTNARDNDPLVIPLWIVAGFLVVMSMYLAARILIPLSISLMLACLVSPATRWLRRTTGMGAAPSALVCLTALVAVLVVATIWSVVGISGLTSADALKDIRVRVVHMVTSEDWLKPFFPNPKELEESMGRIFAPSAGGALHNVGPVLVDSVLVVFMTFFFLAEGDWLLEKMALLFGQTAGRSCGS
jgi:hypothetical protein